MTALTFAVALFFSLQHSAPTQAGPAAGSASAYSITGMVVDALTGSPVRHAEVSILAKDEEKTTTDQSGRFRFDGVEPGKYPLYVSAPGYVREGYNQHGAFLTAIAVGSGLDSEHVLFRLHPQGVIHGRVTDERGEAVRQAQVQLFKADASRGRSAPAMQATAQTDDLGEYRFPHLLAGKYYVVVETRPWYAETRLNYMPDPAPDFGTGFRSASAHHRTGQEGDPALDVVYPATFYPGVTDERSAGELNLSAGATEEANIPLRAIPAVHLRVANLPAGERNQLSIGAGQRVFGTLAGLSVMSGQIAPGEYEVAGLPSGELTLTVNRGGGDAAAGPLNIDANASEGETLDAARTGPTASVSGRILLEEGAAGIEHGNITLMEEGRSSPSAQLRRDGAFSFSPVQAGTYKIFVNLPGDPMYVQKITASGAKAIGRQLTIDGGRDVQLTIVMGQGFGQIRGVALLEDHPADGVMVLLVPESGENLEEDSRMDQSDSDGTFTLGNVVPGKYVLMAIQDGWNLDWQNPAVLKPYREKAQILQVAPGEIKNVNLDVERATK